MPQRPLLIERLRVLGSSRLLGFGPVVAPMTPTPPSQYLAVFGTTKTSAGAILGSCQVLLFRSGDELKVDETTSDSVTGFYEFRGAAPGITYFVVAYKPGSPDVAGTTVNTLVGTTPTGGTHGTYLQTIMQDNPSASWAFDEASGHLIDSVGGANTFSETALTYGVVDTRGVRGVGFNGTTSEARVASAAGLDLGNGPWTVEFWVKPTRVTGTDGIVLDKGSSAYEALMFPAHDFLTLAHGHSSIVAQATVTEVLDGVFHQCAISKSGTTFQLVRDGVDVTGSVTPQTYVDTVSDLVFGNEGGAEWFQGAIARVALYKSALPLSRLAIHRAVG